MSSPTRDAAVRRTARRAAATSNTRRARRRPHRGAARPRRAPPPPRDERSRRYPRARSRAAARVEDGRVARRVHAARRDRSSKRVEPEGRGRSAASARRCRRARSAVPRVVEDRASAALRRTTPAAGTSSASAKTTGRPSRTRANRSTASLYSIRDCRNATATACVRVSAPSFRIALRM